MIALTVLFLSGCFEQVTRAADQAGWIDSFQTDQNAPLRSQYNHSDVSFLLPCTKETKGLSKEQRPDFLQRLGKSIRHAQTRYIIFVLFFWILILTGFSFSRITLRSSLSACFSHHKIISYIHDQDGQK